MIIEDESDKKQQDEGMLKSKLGGSV